MRSAERFAPILAPNVGPQSLKADVGIPTTAEQLQISTRYSATYFSDGETRIHRFFFGSA
jgi:hypothetical protein